MFFFFLFLIVATFRYSLPVLKIYSVRNVYYRFLVLAVNIKTQPIISSLNMLRKCTLVLSRISQIIREIY